MAAVLIIEDDPALSELIRGVLEDEGFRAVVAFSLAEAESVIAQEPIAVIVADLIEFDEQRPARCAQALRSVAGTRPIVLCTGQSGVAGLAEAIGVVALVLKPFDLDVLLGSIRAALAGTVPGGAP